MKLLGKRERGKFWFYDNCKVHLVEENFTKTGKKIKNQHSSYEHFFLAETFLQLHLNKRWDFLKLE
jgi:hypothetical protein